MTPDIERIAREAELLIHRDEWHSYCMDGAHSEELARFAQLIAAECAKVCDAERAEFMPEAAKNNGRQSDFAFGSVNSAERIAKAIREKFGA